MPSADRPLLADLSDESARLLAELRASATARWLLLRDELTQCLVQLRRLAIAWLVAVVVALTSLPVLVVAVAGMLAAWTGAPPAVWQAVLGATLLVTATGLAYWSLRRFQSEFAGLEESLAELAEDAAWLRDAWSSAESAESPPRGPAETS